MREYLDLVRTVMEHGVRKPSRTGVDTLAYFGAFYKVDLAAGFPLLTTKKVNYASCLRELLWYLSGEDHIRNLRKVTKIWDAWADEKGDLETAYGRYWRRFPHPVQKSHAPLAATGERTAPVEEIDQIQYVIDEIKRNPVSRRLVVVAGEPGNAEVSKVPPCHYSFATGFSAPFPNWIHKNASSVVLYLHTIASKCILFRRLYRASGSELRQPPAVSQIGLFNRDRHSRKCYNRNTNKEEYPWHLLLLPVKWRASPFWI